MPATPLRAASSAAMAQETMALCTTGVSAAALSMLRRLILDLVMVPLFSLTARCTASATTHSQWDKALPCPSERSSDVSPENAKRVARGCERPLGAAKSSGRSEGNLQRHLHSAGSVLLRGSHHPEAGAGGVAVGRPESRMVERVV